MRKTTLFQIIHNTTVTGYKYNDAKNSFYTGTPHTTPLGTYLTCSISTCSQGLPLGKPFGNEYFFLHVCSWARCICARP